MGSDVNCSLAKTCTTTLVPDKRVNDLLSYGISALYYWMLELDVHLYWSFIKFIILF